MADPPQGEGELEPSAPRDAEVDAPSSYPDGSEEPPRRPNVALRLSAVGIGVAAVLFFAVRLLVGGFTGPGGLLNETILEEDFSGGAQWQTGDTEDATMDVVDGKYRIRVKSRDFSLQSYQFGEEAYEAVSVEAEVTTSGSQGAVGVSCVSEVDDTTESTENDRYYEFWIFPAVSGYAIGASHTQTNFLADGEAPAVVSATGVNRIRGECVANENDGSTTLRLSVNGRRVVEHRDPKGLTGFKGVGLTVYSFEGGTEGVFDEVAMTRL